VLGFIDMNSQGAVLAYHLHSKKWLVWSVFYHVHTEHVLIYEIQCDVSCIMH
jgi:hypothetical protein